MKYRARYEQYAVLDEVMGSELVKELVVGRGQERRDKRKIGAFLLSIVLRVDNAMFALLVCLNLHVARVGLII